MNRKNLSERARRYLEDPEVGEWKHDLPDEELEVLVAMTPEERARRLTRIGMLPTAQRPKGYARLRA